MKAIILAAGRWTRMIPITDTIPKPLISIAGKPILEHNLEHLYSHVDEIIIIVKYLQEQIKEYFWDNYKGTPITYFEQWEDKWTAGALKGIQTTQDVFIIYGDQILEKIDYNTMFEYKWYGALATKVTDPHKYWIYKTNSEWFAEQLIEKPEHFIWNLANIWGFKLPASIFDILTTLPISPWWEYEIPDLINLFLLQHPFKIFEAQWTFIDVWYPWDILTANSHFLRQLTSSTLTWTVEEWVHIKWNIILGEWAILKSWTYIEWNVIIGKNCNIWPNCYIRWDTIIWNNSHIGNAVEVKNCCIWNNTNAWHLSYLWDSIIWNSVNLWAGFVTANLRHDWKNMRCFSNNTLVDTGKRKLGIIIWDNVQVWVKSFSYPARIIKTWEILAPASIIK